MLRIPEVDDYIAGFPAEVQEILNEVRAAIHRGVPHAAEKIRYGMPAIMIGGRYAIHFAGWKKHVGIYPVAILDPRLEAEVTVFRKAKDSVNFPYTQPIPYELIERIAAALDAKHADVTTSDIS
jgi:uncharacterized protein YdhG (YjbR/CyaY superfamily)